MPWLDMKIYLLDFMPRYGQRGKIGQGEGYEVMSNNNNNNSNGLLTAFS